MHLTQVYGAALYWATATVTTVGFGDITAVTTAERVAGPGGRQRRSLPFYLNRQPSRPCLRSRDTILVTDLCPAHLRVVPPVKTSRSI